MVMNLYFYLVLTHTRNEYITNLIVLYLNF